MRLDMHLLLAAGSGMLSVVMFVLSDDSQSDSARGTGGGLANMNFSLLIVGTGQGTSWQLCLRCCVLPVHCLRVDGV